MQNFARLATLQCVPWIGALSLMQNWGSVCGTPGGRTPAVLMSGEWLDQCPSDNYSKKIGELTPSLKYAIIMTEPKSKPTLVVSMFWSYWMGGIHATDISDKRFYVSRRSSDGNISKIWTSENIPTDTDDSVPKIPGQYLKLVHNTRSTFSRTLSKSMTAMAWSGTVICKHRLTC